MKFKIVKGTALFEKLSELQAKCTECNKAARALADQQGANGFASGRNMIAGGIAALCFDDKPEGYRLLQQPNYYYPKVTKANRPLHDAIAALPTVGNDDLNGLLNYKFQTVCDGDKMYWASRPGVIWGEEQILVDTGKAKYEPVADMIEILESEYLRLQGK
ncbi:hypothetical protein MUN82_04050 [Hymenobacter aerilatus]|uniref:Uncharacterized protein n=1 Tax=Hymenobacter aerilatus TaxID=2932251 RepID=A0A8T9SVR5_9BACT|nr:hypothetical protein [Hymenobacter aerilatus]UOR06272.1 hypothetical protein MUN82_04050 [Hymenobacter aerilatus]